MTAVALVVLQSDGAADAAPTLAVLPGALRYLVGPYGRTAEHVPGVRELSLDDDRRAAAAALVARDSGVALVVVLRAGESVSPELAAALAGLPHDGAPASFSAARVHRFLGREVAGEPAVIAWRGDVAATAPPVALPGRLIVAEPDITTAIERVDAASTRAARRHARIGIRDFVTTPLRRLLARLWMRRRDGVPGLVLSALETYAEVVAAAKVWEHEERTTRMRVRSSSRVVPAGFIALETRAGFVVVRDDLREPLVAVLLGATPEIVDGEPLARGGRGATWSVVLPRGERAVLRWYRRGGALRRLVRDRYFGWPPRPLVELAITAEARRRGIAVPEVLGARVDRVAGGYRGAIVTREIAAAETLGEAARRAPQPAERAAIVRGVARAVRTMHDHGLHHRDLNVGNILLSRGGDDELAVYVIDLDRARLRGSVSRRARGRALRRLGRSLAKLEAPALPDADVRVEFHRAYREGA